MTPKQKQILVENSVKLEDILGEWPELQEFDKTVVLEYNKNITCNN